jgi:hypothetical protein
VASLRRYRRPGNAGIIHKPVDGTEPRGDVAHSCLRKLRVRDAAHIRQQTVVRGGGKGFELLAVDIDPHNTCAKINRCSRNRISNSLRWTRDDNYLAL